MVYVIGDRVRSSPAIGADGTIYIGSNTNYGKVYAINSDGSEKWSWNPPLIFNTLARVRSSPAIGADGTIYIGTDCCNHIKKLFRII